MRKIPFRRQPPESEPMDPRGTVGDLKRQSGFGETQPGVRPIVAHQKKSGLEESRGWILHRAAGPILAHGHQSVQRPSHCSGEAPGTEYLEFAWPTPPSQILPSRSVHARSAPSTELLTTLLNLCDIQRFGDRGLAPNRRANHPPAAH